MDQLTGATLTYRPSQGPVLTALDGTRTDVAVQGVSQLAPGATQLYDFRGAPPAIVLQDAIGATEPKTFWLPEGSNIGTAAPGGPVWEDPDHLLVMVSYSNQLEAPTVRLNIRSGEFQRVPLTDHAGYRAQLVIPLLHA
jgi:hypothetical protein